MQCVPWQTADMMGGWIRRWRTFKEVGCPAPVWRSDSLEGACEDAEAKPLERGMMSLIGDTVRGACSPMLPSLPSSGIAESKADTCRTGCALLLPAL